MHRGARARGTLRARDLSRQLTGPGPLLLFALALAVLFASKAKLVVPAVIGAAALWGLLSQALGAPG